MPFLLIAIIIVHLISLHTTGSRKPLGSNPNLDKITFNPFFSIKDIKPIVIIIIVVFLLSYINPFLLGDPENFNIANPLNTPIHIQPE